jgi:hypothetical protein
MSLILQKYREMNCNLQTAAREMSDCEYAQLFSELVHIRSQALHDEAQAIWSAERRSDERWQGVVAEKDNEIARQAAIIAEYRARLGED